MAKDWSVRESAKLYNLKGWGRNYFGINEKGNLTFQPRRSTKRVIDIKRVIEDVQSRGFKLPVLIRFQDVVRDRVATLNRAFRKAIKEYSYGNRYQGVYPIKVNQLREVVEEVLDAGEPFAMGLEAGSKPELMAVLAMNKPEALSIVNGYKDAQMMRLACLGMKLGKKVVVVVEKLSELNVLLREAESFGVKPQVGLRARLSTPGSGKWKESGGHGAKFGLTTPEIMAAVKELEKRGMVDCVKLVHFHIGSQITDIQTIQEAVREGARIYAKLHKIGVKPEYLDCGGGLGVDYEGGKTTSDFSMNYNLEEYAREVVYSIQEVCQQEKVPEPAIVTESGRSLTAHHALLVVDVFGSIETGAAPIDVEETEKEHRVVADIRDVMKGLTEENLGESYHDGVRYLDESQSLFRHGLLSLEDKAKVETLYWRLCLAIREKLPKAKKFEDDNVPEDLERMAKQLHDQYLVNFSVFQSLPDAWGMEHVFPIVPIQRLDQEPTRKTVLADITCDSEGNISRFVCGKSTRKTLPLHPINGDPYYLGIFLMGAYQATLGDIHNLFGRVNEVHIFEDDEEPGGYYIEETIHGQRIADVLESIQYNRFELSKGVKSAIDQRVKSGELKPREGVDLLNFYERVMKEYTYIDHQGSPKRRATDTGVGDAPEQQGRTAEPA